MSPGYIDTDMADRRLNIAPDDAADIWPGAMPPRHYNRSAARRNRVRSARWPRFSPPIATFMTAAIVPSTAVHHVFGIGRQ